jgi:hypothetical protein
MFLRPHRSKLFGELVDRIGRNPLFGCLEDRPFASVREWLAD